MDPCNTSLDEIIRYRFNGNGTPTGNRTGGSQSTSLVDLPLDQAIPIMRARQQTRNFTEKRPYEMTTAANGSRAPIQKFRLRSIDPLTNSLEAIIEQVEDEDEVTMKKPFKPSTVVQQNPFRPSTVVQQNPFRPSTVVQQNPFRPSTVVQQNPFRPSTVVRNNPFRPSTFVQKNEQANESSDQSRQNVTGSELPEYPEYTPCRAVGYLARNGMPITILVGQQKDFKFKNDRSHKWRCIISSGNLKVMADSIRKQVAREMAAVEFLEQLAKTDKSCKIPKYTILPEIFIDPRIIHKLEKKAIEMNLDTANYVKVRFVRKPNGRPGGDDVDYMFVATFLVGKAAYKGESFLQEYAQLLAAKRAYEGLTETEVTPIKYFTGALCDPTMEYEFGESEISQSMIYKKSEAAKIPEEAPKDFKKFKTAGRHTSVVRKPEP